MSVPAEAEAVARGRISPQTITFSWSPSMNPQGSDAEYAAKLLQHILDYVDIDVAGLVQRYLRDVNQGLDAQRAEQLSLRTDLMIREVLSAVRTNLNNRLGFDFATTLLPRLERTPVQ